MSQMLVKEDIQYSTFIEQRSINDVETRYNYLWFY